MNTEEIKLELEYIGKKSRRAAAALAVLPPEAKAGCLTQMADGIAANSALIMEANAKDIANARSAGMDEAKIDRLTLNDSRIAAMADGLRQVAAQCDPVGRIISQDIRPNGLEITKISVPFGVIGIIYEACYGIRSEFFLYFHDLVGY